jgi:hypothetical protein
MKLKRGSEYDALSDAVESGIAYGWARAHKHVDTPTQQAIADAIRNAIMNAICDAFDFDDEVTP